MIINKSDRAIRLSCDSSTLPSDLTKCNYFRNTPEGVELVEDNTSTHDFAPVAQGARLFDIDTSKWYMYTVATNVDAIEGQTGTWNEVTLGSGGGGGEGTDNYNQLSNKPQINSTTLQGNKSNLDLDIFDVKSGTSLPSGEKVGQLFLLLEDVVQATKTVKKGLYRYNGSVWELRLDKTPIVDITDEDDLPENPVEDTFYIVKDTFNIYTEAGTNRKFQQLEYIRSGEKQYISTKYLCGPEIKQEIRLKAASDIGNEAVLFGGDNGFNWGTYLAGYFTASNLGMCLGGNNTYLSVPQFQTEVVYDAVFDKTGIELDGVKYEKALTFKSGYNILLLGCGSKYGKFSIYTWKIYDNNVLVRDYVPVRLLDDDESQFGLFDKVDNKFYPNVGVGDGLANFHRGNVIGFEKGVYFYTNGDYKRLDNTEFETLKENNRRDVERIIGKLKDKQPVKIVCFGDSITQGERAVIGGYSPKPYPARLQELLRLVFDNENVTVLNKGTSGETSSVALTKINSSVIREFPDLCIYMYGTNDSADPTRFPSTLYRSNMLTMYEMMRHAGIAVCGIIMPPRYMNYGIKNYTSTMQQQSLDYLREVQYKFFEQNNIPYCDLYKQVMDIVDKGVMDPFELQPDGAHFPSDYYSFMGDTVVNDLFYRFNKAGDYEYLPFAAGQNNMVLQGTSWNGRVYNIGSDVPTSHLKYNLLITPTDKPTDNLNFFFYNDSKKKIKLLEVLTNDGMDNYPVTVHTLSGDKTFYQRGYTTGTSQVLDTHDITDCFELGLNIIEYDMSNVTGTISIMGLKLVDENEFKEESVELTTSTGTITDEDLVKLTSSTLNYISYQGDKFNYVSSGKYICNKEDDNKLSVISIIVDLDTESSTYKQYSIVKTYIEPETFKDRTLESKVFKFEWEDSTDEEKGFMTFDI